jgi:hypothetical protein
MPGAMDNAPGIAQRQNSSSWLKAAYPRNVVLAIIAI